MRTIWRNGFRRSRSTRAQVAAITLRRPPCPQRWTRAAGRTSPGCIDKMTFQRSAAGFGRPDGAWHTADGESVETTDIPVNNARVQRTEGLFRKELNPLRRACANARFWESSRFPCSEAAGRIGQLGVESASSPAIFAHEAAVGQQLLMTMPNCTLQSGRSRLAVTHSGIHREVT